MLIGKNFRKLKYPDNHSELSFKLNLTLSFLYILFKLKIKKEQNARMIESSNKKYILKVSYNGLLTGLLLQTAIGPVFFFVINLSLQNTFWDGFLAVLAVTLVDYLYITLAVRGVGKLLEKGKRKKILAIISSIVLILFGIFLLTAETIKSNSIHGLNSSNYFNSFFSAFFLTASSPLTIVFWTGLFASKAIENNYAKNELFIFGFFAGLATLLFLSTAIIIISSFKASMPFFLVSVLNEIVGLILILYGILKFVKVLKRKSDIEFDKLTN